MTNLRAGEIFKDDGYEVVAHAGVLEGGGPCGEVVVYTNNSSCYLVALRQGDCGEAMLLASFPYEDEDNDASIKSLAFAYRGALTCMTREALRR